MASYQEEVAYTMTLPAGDVNSGGTLLKIPLPTLMKLFWLYKSVDLSGSITYDYEIPAPPLSSYPGYDRGTLTVPTQTFYNVPLSTIGPPPAQRVAQYQWETAMVNFSLNPAGTWIGSFQEQGEPPPPDSYNTSYGSLVNAIFFAPLNLASNPNYNPNPALWGNVCVDRSRIPFDYYVRLKMSYPSTNYVDFGFPASTDPADFSFSTIPPVTGVTGIQMHLQMDGSDIVPSIPVYSLPSSSVISGTPTGNLTLNFNNWFPP